MTITITTFCCYIYIGAKKLGEYSITQEALLTKKDQLQFLNSEHGSFANEVQQAIQQLCNLQNTYGDNLYAPVGPNAVQETLDAGALESV